MQCDKGLLYDSKLSVCNWASQVQCGETASDPKTTTVPQTTTTPFPSSTRPPFPSSTTASFPSSTTASLTTPSNGYPSCANSGFYFLPHETNCEFYYICAFGATLRHNCGPGIHWSAELNQCDYPERARCRQSTPATPPTTTTVAVNTTTKPEYAAPVLPPRKLETSFAPSYSYTSIFQAVRAIGYSIHVSRIAPNITSALECHRLWWPARRAMPGMPTFHSVIHLRMSSARRVIIRYMLSEIKDIF